MNKILNINLGGMPFTIDIDAYTHLETYLSTIRRHFSDSESCDEIIHDIEVRMGELFQESMKGSSIISNKELDEVIKIMGTPEDFGAEAIEDDYETHSQHESYTSRDDHKTGKKRLFRDGEDKVLAGLCSGIAAYFGIDDPLWIRITFVVLLFAGISPILYILLWAIVPVARTSSDKLSMRGENINISNIAKTVEEEITELSKRISEIGKDLSSKKKSSSHVDADEEDYEKRRNFILRGFAALFALIGAIFSGVFGLIGKTGKTIFKIVGGALAIALGLVFIALILGISMSLPVLQHVGPDSLILSSLGSLSIYLTLGIPLFFGLSIITKSLLGYRMKNNWNRSLGMMWIAALALTGYSVSNTMNEYQVSNSISDTYSKSIDSDVIKLVMDYENESEFNFINVMNIKSTSNGLHIGDIGIDIIKSNDNELHITKKVTASGSSKKVSINNASKVKSDFDISDNGTISIPRNFVIEKGNKYRGQEVKYTIAIPEGKKVNFDGSIENKLYSSSFDHTQSRPYNEEEYTWEMGNEGLFSSEYNKIANYKLKIPVDQISSLFIEGDFDIDLVQAEEAGISIVGNQELVKNVEFSTINGSVNIKNNNSRYSSKKLKLYAHVTQLDQLNLEDVHYTKLEGLTQENLSIYSSGNGDITGVMDIENLELNLDGHQSIDLMGKGKNLDVQIGHNTDLNLSKYLVANATVKGDLYRRGKLNVEKALNCKENTLRNLEVIGSPIISDTSTTLEKVD